MGRASAALAEANRRLAMSIGSITYRKGEPVAVVPDYLAGEGEG